MKIITIIESAKKCKTNVEKHQKTGVKDTSAYYYAKTLLGAKESVKKINIKAPSKLEGDYISRQISKANYIDMAERLVEYVEEKGQMPSYIKYGKIRVEHKLYTYLFACVVTVAYVTGKLPKEVNISSKLFVAKTETSNVVYNYACKKFGKIFKTIDETLAYVGAYFHYLKYYDDHMSNKEVTDKKQGNCTDLLQWLFNMAKAMGYECKCIHVKCRVSGTGHVYGQFKHPKHTGGKWITRDIAAVADGGSITHVWCNDGYKLAENPSWFMTNVNR